MGNEALSGDDAPFIQSYIAPICIAKFEENGLNIKSQIGTCFFISKTGVFVTARHVIESANQLATALGAKWGMVTKRDNGRSTENDFFSDFSVEYAPAPSDIAVGRLNFHPDTPLRWRTAETSIWQEVATVGYPISIIAPVGRGHWLCERAQRGHVQRLIKPEHVTIGPKVAGFELSFSVARGISGAPAFSAGREVLGVITGNRQSEEIDSEILEILENGTEYRERRVRLEEFGFVESITPLFDWKPALLAGKSLGEAGA